MYLNDMLHDLTGKKEDREKIINVYEDDTSYNSGVFAGLKYNSLKLMLEYVKEKIKTLQEKDMTDFERGQVSAYSDIGDKIYNSIGLIDDWLKGRL